ncbi:MAG: hypothetical protein AAF738_08655, partial [Bacteroidota bacterium]
MHQLYLILVISSFLSSTLLGQELVLKKINCHSTKRELMHDMIQSINGDLIIVGETGEFKSKRPKQALLLLVDPTTEQIERKLFGTPSFQNVFYAITQIEDGGFYVVGESTPLGKKQSKQSWILRLDEHGNTIEEYKLGEGAFKQVVVLDNHRLAVAKDLKRESGVLEIGLFEDGKITYKNYGQGELGTLEGMIPTEDGNFIVCGNRRKNKSLGTEAGEVYLLKIASDGQLLDEKIIKHDNRHIQLCAVNTDYNGNLILTGNEGQESWIAAVDHQLELYSDEVIKGEHDERGLGIAKNVYDQYLLIDGYTFDQFKRARVLQNFEQFGAEIYLPQEFVTLTICKVLYTYQDNYIIAANVAGKNGFIYLLKLTEGEFPVPKNRPILKSIPPIKLKDDNRDGILSPNERGAIAVNVINMGDYPIRNATIEVYPKSDQTDIRYFEVVHEAYIGAGKEEEINIPFNGAANLKGGTYEFEIVFSEAGRQIETIETQIKARQTSTGSGIFFVELLTENKEQDARTNGGFYELKAKIYSDRPLRQDD